MHGAVISTVEFASTARERKIRRSRRQHLGELVTRGVCLTVERSRRTPVQWRGHPDELLHAPNSFF